MTTTRLEREFQPKLILELRQMFPGAIIQKLNANYQQGIPDLLILWYNKWALLECKRSANEARQPNQEYYVEKLNEWSFASFIYPENKEEVLNALQAALRA